MTFKKYRNKETSEIVECKEELVPYHAFVFKDTEKRIQVMEAWLFKLQYEEVNDNDK